MKSITLTLRIGGGVMVRDYSLNKLIQILWEKSYYIDDFLRNPREFAKKINLSLTDDEIKLLLNADTTTLKEYFKYGFDSRIGKTLWLWYYKQFLGNAVIHAIPNCSYGGIAVHQFMLADMIRNYKFKQAIEEAINKASIVADVGAGTGILSLWASKTGAKKVYGIEKDKEIVRVASEIIRENGIDNIELICSDASHVILPEKVDVILSECIGSFGINSNLIPTVIQFRENNLKENGIIIPNRISLIFVPYETIFYDIWVNFAERDILGLSIKSIDKYLKNQIFSIIGDTTGFLSKPKVLFTLDLRRYSDKIVKFAKQVEFAVSNNGIFHGFLGWFLVYFTPKIILDTSPSNPRTHWYQVFFPIKDPVKVQKGDVIYAKISAKITQFSINWKWNVYINGISFRHDTDKSYPSKHNIKSSGGSVHEKSN